MTENDKSEFCETIEIYLEACGKQTTGYVLAAWWNMLKWWPLELVQSTLDSSIRYDVNPVPASIVIRIRGLTHD